MQPFKALTDIVENIHVQIIGRVHNTSFVERIWTYASWKFAPSYGSYITLKRMKISDKMGREVHSFDDNIFEVILYPRLYQCFPDTNHETWSI